ncbi:MAG: Rrf2 family transcriptional regulator [Candidatus Margulisbacteria bacterium]|nr:Rrf2 family transcriptional regulator [Candidatus Margulisiibacteriota bacterium]
MQITRASDYAIRLLAHLAAGEVETTSQTLSNELGVPLNHLAKLVQNLARRGYLITRKGKGGGLRLAVDPKKINLAQVIEAIEGPIMINKCLFHSQSCRFSRKCKVRKCLGGVQGKIQEMLASTTIFDMALQYS